MISILCPSRSRPDKAKRMLESAIKNPGCPIEIMFFLNHDDSLLEEYKTFLTPFQYIIGPNQSPVYSWNLMAQNAKHDIVFLVGDDAQFSTENWGAKVVHAFEQYPDKIVCVYPKPQFKQYPNPHFCLHKNWIQQLGYFLPPSFYLHYVDTWIAYVAKKLNRFHCIDDFEMPVEIIYDEVHNSYEKTWLHQRDKWMWERTVRHRDSDAEILKKFIEKQL